MKFKLFTICETCEFKIDGTPGEIYEIERHEESCQNCDYERYQECVDCGHQFRAGQDTYHDCEYFD